MVPVSFRADPAALAILRLRYLDSGTEIPCVAICRAFQFMYGVVQLHYRPQHKSLEYIPGP